MEQRSLYSDWATGYTVRGLNPAGRKDFFSFPKRPDPLWGPPNLLFNGAPEFSPGSNAAGVSKLTIRLHLAPRSGATSLVKPYAFMVSTGTLPLFIYLWLLLGMVSTSQSVLRRI
jgi:hypothetical protein